MIVAIIPARGGSKGIPKKNIIPIHNHPLIAYSIAVAQLSPRINRTIVSTDSREIAQIAKRYGAEAPFLRPKKIARDSSPDIDFIRHVIEWFKQYEKTIPDLLVHLRPTTPLREPKMITSAIKKIIGEKKATALRSVHEIPESPHKYFTVKGKYLKGLFPEDTRPEYYNLPRQAFDTVYMPDGYVDIIKSSTVIKKNLLHGDKILPFFIPADPCEIDRPEDIAYATYKMEQKNYEIVSYLESLHKK